MIYNLNNMVVSFRKSNTLRSHQSVYGNILVGLSFMALTFLTVKTFAPDIKSNAETQNISETVGPYTMSMSNDTVASINITPTASQTIYTGTNNLTVKNTFPDGATITLTTNSTTSNSLVRTGTDSGIKEIPATSTTSLSNNSWGYALDNTETYNAVPKKGTTPATIYDAVSAQTTNLTVPVKYGIKTDNTLPSGTYSADVVYSMSPKSGCLGYTVTWDMDGGTRKDGATYPSLLGWGDTVDLSTLTPTRTGYVFTGWTNGTSTFDGTETNANINSANTKTVTIKAKWTKLMAENLEYTPPTGVTCTNAQCMIDYLNSKLSQ